MATFALDLKTRLSADLGMTEFATRCLHFLMCPRDLDPFDGEAVMHVLRTHPRIYINGILIQDSHYIRTKQFLGTP